MRLRNVIGVSALAAVMTVSVVAQERGGGNAPRVPPMVLTVQGFADGGEIPLKFTQAAPATGTEPSIGVSPAMSWTNVPPGTQSFVMHFHDLDVARNRTTDDNAHWLVWNIAPTTTSLPEAAPRSAQMPDGAYQQSPSGPVYRGPGAAATGPLHHYAFEVYALDTKLDVQPGADVFATRTSVMAAMQGHILGKAVYTGRFRRPQ